MGIIPDNARSYIGFKTEALHSNETVERGAVRRFAQAIMDDDPIFNGGAEAPVRYGGPVAPPLFPQWMFRRDFDDPDLIQENAADPDFDGIAATVMQGLPPIDAFQGFNVLNGGSEIEFYRYALHGEKVKVTSSYEDMFEKMTRKGPMVFIIVASEYRTEAGELLLIIRRTSIRRPL